MSRNDRKRTFEPVRQINIEISLRIHAVWSESTLGGMTKDTKPQADSCGQRRLVDPSLYLAHMSKGTFSYVADPNLSEGIGSLLTCS